MGSAIGGPRFVGGGNIVKVVSVPQGSSGLVVVSDFSLANESGCDGWAAMQPASAKAKLMSRIVRAEHEYVTGQYSDGKEFSLSLGEIRFVSSGLFFASHRLVL